MVQWVKDPALSLQQLGMLLRLRFDPWRGNFCMLQAQPKKRKRNENKKTENILKTRNAQAHIPLSLRTLMSSQVTEPLESYMRE